MKNQDTLARATKTLMLSEPFYGYFLMGLNKEWDESVETAGVSKHNIGFKLTVAPTFWEGLTDLHQLGIMKHELLHLAFFHLTMRDKYPDKQLFNIAADMEINQYIDKSWLPEGCIDVDKFKQEIPHLDYKKGTDYYYKELSQVNKKPKGDPGKDLLDQYMGDPGSDMHGTWKDFDSLSQAEKKLLESQAEHQMKNTAEAVQKRQGSIPGELSDLIKGFYEKTPPKFDWKGYLRRFAGGSQKIYTKKLRRKFNKRFSHLPGLKIKPKKHILVGVDTSASVCSKELEEFFCEIQHMYKTGAEITVIQCDTRIVDISPYKKGAEQKIHGRGGTSFTPVVDHYNKYKSKYSCLIYLTDGEASNPSTPPKGRTLWVLSERSSMNDKLPGQVIKLSK